ncbi:MAG: replicative DNA helicase [Oligoflexia bacterium]|nr:replicative DNA helicase [Oligoflexia bacterium]
MFLKQRNEVESGLLYCLLTDNESYKEIKNYNLKETDFTRRSNQILFKAILRLIDKEMQVDYSIIITHLTNTGELELLGDGEDNRGTQYINNLFGEFVTSANVREYARMIKDASTKREFITLNHSMNRKAELEEEDIAKLISTHKEDISKLLRQETSLKTKTLGAYIPLILNDISNGENDAIETGFYHLDKHLGGGIRRGEFVIIAARPGMGKTSLALNIAINVSEKYKNSVLFISLEMSANEIVKKYLSSQCSIDHKSIVSKQLQSTDVSKIAQIQNKESNNSFWIDDTGGLLITDIKRICRTLSYHSELSLIVIDYIQLISSSSKTNNREQVVSEISRELKALAKELLCPVIALSQLNRSVESRENKRPSCSELRESGSLEQDADKVFLIYREDFYNLNEPKVKGKTEIIIGKNRNGENGCVMLKWESRFTTFKDADDFDWNI